MKRRALIVYCDNTSSGELNGPVYDNANFIDYLTSYSGGEWFDNEIMSLRNPTSYAVSNAVTNFLNGADYTFTIFTGHGFINTDQYNLQFIELADKDISIVNLRTDANRQTLIVDACRGFYSPTRKQLIKGFSDLYDSFDGSKLSTRKLFDNAVLSAEEGWTILFAADENQTALDTDEGAAYLLSLLKTSENWERTNRRDNVLTLSETHEAAKIYLAQTFPTNQRPTTNGEKRRVHYPFAVKFTPLHS